MSIPNQTCLTAIEIGALPYIVVVNTATAGNSPSSPDTDCGSGNSFNSAWYKKTVPAGVYQLACNVNSIGGDGIITVFDGTCGALTPNPADCTGVGNTLLIPTTPGSLLYFMLTTYVEGGEVLEFTVFEPESTGDFCKVLSCGDNPVVTQIRANCSDSPVTLTITGTGFATPPSVILTANGDPVTFSISSSTTTEINLSDLSPAFDSGANYCVTVDDSSEFCSILTCTTPSMGSGLYYIERGKREDTVFTAYNPDPTTEDVAIPNPFIETYFVGDE